MTTTLPAPPLDPTRTTPSFVRQESKHTHPSYRIAYRTGEMTPDVTSRQQEVVIEMVVEHDKAKHNNWHHENEPAGFWVNVSVVRVGHGARSLHIDLTGTNPRDGGLRAFALPAARFNAKQLTAVVAWLEARRDMLVMPILTQWRTDQPAAQTAYRHLIRELHTDFPPKMPA